MNCASKGLSRGYTRIDVPAAYTVANVYKIIGTNHKLQLSIAWAMTRQEGNDDVARRKFEMGDKTQSPFPKRSKC